jgi:branched-chain amino acid transport system substrate-binding protein
MKQRLFTRLATLATLSAAAFAAASLPAIGADTLRVGFMTTLSGPAGALGVDIRDGFNLAVKHAGGKLGGIPLDLQIADDQLKPDVAKQITERFLQQQKSHIVTGVVFTNILLPVVPSILESKTFYISPNTGPNDYAGAKCNPYFFVASWQSEDIPSAMGKFVTDRGIKNVYLIGANYPGGRENLSGFKRLYKGNIVDEVYTPMNQLDFSVDLANMQAKKPEAVFIFLPGGMGINFIKQFAAAGLSKNIQLFVPGYSADEDTIKPVGSALLGAVNTSFWGHDLDNPQNKKFVADFEKDYGRLPTLYAAQGYDTAMLIDSAVRKVKGNVEDKVAFRKALMAADFKSVRGNFKFNKNQYPIQDYYLRVVRTDEKGRITNRLMGKILSNHEDSFASQCKMPGM